MTERAARATLRIVSFNDVYALENLPRLKSLVEHHRRAPPAPDAFLVTLPGDFLSPSLLSSLDAGRGMIDCLRALGVDMVTFGNHEDDLSLEELRARVRELGATWLATNVRALDPSLPVSRVVELPGGLRVGFLGVVMTDETVYRRRPFGGALPAEDAALREAARLASDDRCDAVIPLTHQSMDDDRRLARAAAASAGARAAPPFPVILGGHEHTPFLEQVGSTWIVKAGTDAEHAVVVDVALERARGEGEGAGGAGAGAARVQVSVLLDDTAKYPDDPALRARVERHMARVRELEHATLLVLPPGESLSSVGTRRRQTSMGALVCSRIRDALGADACVFNGGGIRGAREHAGKLTYGDLEAEVPFDNEVVVARLPGRVLRDAVRASRAQAPAESAAFLQVDDRVVVGEGDAVTELAGAPLDPDRDYRVALVRNLLAGLDHIEPLVAFAKASPERVPPPGSGREVKQILVDAFALDLWSKLGGFDAVDANHDGVVTADEVAAAVARVNAEAPSPITAGLIIRALDRDHDRAIERAESAGQPAPGPARGPVAAPGPAPSPDASPTPRPDDPET